MEPLAPATADDVADVVQAALANETPLAITGNGTLASLGRPVTASRGLSTRALRGIHFYEPSELVVSLGPGTTMRELVDALDQHGQELAFDPIDYAAIYGTEPLAGTVGAMAAVNAAGPRRIKAGAARDHVLGFTAVSGRGDIFKSGGRVMKNVTGYDLSKLMTGSYGTLAVLTDLTLKVLPKAEMEETLLLRGLDDATAVHVMTEASGLPHEVSSFAHLPAMAAAGLDPPFASAEAMTALRLEGPEISVTKRKADLIAHFRASGGAFDTVPPNHSRAFWQAVRDCRPLAARPADIWRVSTAPAKGAAFTAALRAKDLDLTHYYDWAGGLVWIATGMPAAEASSVIRDTLAAFGGHATLIRADAQARQTVPVFHPQPQALAALTARIKTSFDPEKILNRGRMRDDL